jgi:hypothetical protein
VWGDQVLDANEIFTNWPAWAERVVWGNRVIWGNRVVWGNGTVWSDASRIVWGERVVWGNGLVGYVDGTRIVWGDAVGLANVEASRVVWGNVADTTRGALSTESDPYGVIALDGGRPVDASDARPGRRVNRELAHRGFDRLNARGDR